MADKYPGPGGQGAPETYGGQPGSWLQRIAGSPDLRYGEHRIISKPQEASQLGGLALAMKRLATGFNAGDQSAARAAEYRNLNEQVLPQIREHFGAGLGGGSAFNRNVAGAVAASNERLNALREGRQHELQKLQQEQLPRLMELGLKPTFQGHITEGEWNPEAAPKESLSNILERSKTGEAIGRAAEAYDPSLAAAVENVGEAGLRTIKGVKSGAKFAGRKLNDKTAQALNAIGKKYPKLMPSIEKLMAAPGKLEEATRHKNIPLLRETKKTTEKPGKEGYAEQRELLKIAKNLKLKEGLTKLLTAKDLPALKEMAKRKRVRDELADIDTPEELHQVAQWWADNPSKRSKIGDFIKGLFGKRKAKKG